MQLEHGGQRVSVAAGDFFIGSAAGAALALTGDAVLPQHAVVRLAGGHLVILPAVPGARIRVNGSPIGADPTPLLHGDRIGIGSHEIIVTDPARGGATRILAAADVPDSRRGSDPAGSPAPVEELAGRFVSLNDGREYRIDPVAFVFGRDAMAQIVIASPDASRRHAEVVSRPDGDVLVDLSANGTSVNGQRVAGRHLLMALDVVRIGSEEFRYYPPVKPQPTAAAVRLPAVPRLSAPSDIPPDGAEFRLGDTLMGMPSFRTGPAAPAVPTVPKPLATLRVKTGSSKGERFPVKTPVVNIGRADFNDIRLSDPSVSSSHAKLQLREGVWTLSDLGSTNGTKVDGLPVADEVALSPGAIVTLGEVEISFEPQDERPTPPARTAVLAQAAPPNVPPPSAPAAEARVGRSADAAPRVTRPVAPILSALQPRRRNNTVLLIVAIVVLVAALAALVFLF